MKTHTRKLGHLSTGLTEVLKYPQMLPENKGQFFFHSSVTCFSSASSHCQSFLCHFCLLRKRVGSFHLSKSVAPNKQVSKCQIPPLLNFLPVSCYHIPSFNPHDKPSLLTGSLLPISVPSQAPLGCLLLQVAAQNSGVPAIKHPGSPREWIPEHIYPAAQQAPALCVLLPSNKHKPINIFQGYQEGEQEDLLQVGCVIRTESETSLIYSHRLNRERKEVLTIWRGAKTVTMKLFFCIETNI